MVISIWWVVGLAVVALLWFAVNQGKQVLDKVLEARNAAAVQLGGKLDALHVQLSELSKRLEGAELIGGYLAGLQRVAEAQVVAVTKLTESVDAFGGLVLAPKVTSADGRKKLDPVQEVNVHDETLAFLTDQYRRDEGMDEETARHHAILDAEIGATPGY